MGVNLKFHARKMNQLEILIAYIVFLPFCFGLLLNLIGLPNSIKYTLDIAWVMLGILIITNMCQRQVAFSKLDLPMLLCPICFFLFVAVVYLFRYQSALYFLWGFRNNFRFYVFFAAVIFFLRKEDIKQYFKLFDVLFWVNSVVCLYQYFVLNKYQDFLGGVFGTERGCNSYLNIFLIVVIIKTAIFYLNKNEKLLSLVCKSAMSLLIASIAELKFFYIEFVAIIICSVLITKFSWRKLFIIVIALITMAVSIQMMFKLFPHYINFFNLERIIQSVTTGGYDSSAALNRFTTVPIISKRFLTTNVDKTIGLGLGNCDTSAYAILNTPFHEQYYSIRYSWFLSAIAFLETGYVGLIFLFGFFVVVGITAILHTKRKTEKTVEDIMYSQISAIMAACCIMLAIYDSSLRTEAAYIAYFVLALPFAGNKIINVVRK